jgi:hypothetical protein
LAVAFELIEKRSALGLGRFSFPELTVKDLRGLDAPERAAADFPLSFGESPDAVALWL